MKEYLGNPKNTIEIIQKYEFMFQKKFGQNFLIDTHVLEKIINAAGVTKEDVYKRQTQARIGLLVFKFQDLGVISIGLGQKVQVVLHVL